MQVVCGQYVVGMWLICSWYDMVGMWSVCGRHVVSMWLVRCMMLSQVFMLSLFFSRYCWTIPTCSLHLARRMECVRCFMQQPGYQENSLSKSPGLGITGPHIHQCSVDHSQESSTSNFPCTHSMTKMAFHSLLQMKNDYTTNSHYLTYTFLIKRLGGCTLFGGRKQIFQELRIKSRISSVSHTFWPGL